MLDMMQQLVGGISLIKLVNQHNKSGLKAKLYHSYTLNNKEARINGNYLKTEENSRKLVV